MKRGIRILAIDDSPFKRGEDRHTFLVGLLFRELILELSLREIIEVDGNDSTDAIIRMSTAPGIQGEAKLILAHGTTFGGLNVLDLRRVYRITGVPIIAVTSREPTEEIERALISAGMKDKIPLVRRNPPYIPVKTSKGTSYISSVGISYEEASRLVARFSIESKIPEQLRIVDIVARILEGLSP
ncbi:MAG: hypothetical protein DRN78_01425 [Thermoproteota archaeon]|nr:MAG: hypothetical protein DRN78_01425 [Candidatus Korarchaeota archaeon]